MDRTKKLMTSVTASILMIGPTSFDQLPQQKARCQDNLTVRPGDRFVWPPLTVLAGTIAGASEMEWAASGPRTSKGSAEVEEAAQLILGQLPDSETQAKSLDELLKLKELSKIKRATAEKALQMLLEQGDIRRTGAGTKERPFRYFKRKSTGG